MYKQFLLAIDGSELAFQAARAGIELARSEGARVAGLFVTRPYSPPFIYPTDMTYPYPTREEYEYLVKQEAELCLRRIADLAEEANVEWQQVIKAAENPAKAIVDTAEKLDCDLIVMGSHGRSGVGQLVLGSVTAKVLAACEVPVLVYRHREKPNRRRTPSSSRASRKEASFPEPV